MTTRSVSIVGGGIAGLTLAATLDPVLFDVRLIEAQPERHGIGAALGLWPSARAALDRIGAWTRLAASSEPAPHRGSLHTITGRRLATTPSPDLRLVERATLMDALDDARPSSVRVEHRTVSDPGALDADLVIGADGVRSTVRGCVDKPRAQRKHTPYVVLRGITRPGAGTSFGEYWGGGRLFGIAPLTGGRAYWFACWRSGIGPEPLDVETVVAEANTQFDGSAPLIRRTLAGDQTGTLGTRLWTAPPMRRYVSGRYVVIGDAAHAALPNLGRGACDAILDAATLAETLNEGGSLRRWQAGRLPFTQAARFGAAAIMRVALANPLGSVGPRRTAAG